MDTRGGGALTDTLQAPTLVVSDPPHGDVDLEAVAELLELDVFATRLKLVFSAPEVMLASGREEAGEFAGALGATGFRVSILDGTALTGVPWPYPVSSLALDVSCLRGAMGEGAVTIPYDAPVVGVYCRPPKSRPMRSAPARSAQPAVELDRAVASGHGPTIAQAIQHMTILDLYFREEGLLRRATILPTVLDVDGERLLKDLGARFERLRLDTRLAGVRPRAPFTVERGFSGSERRRYSFGTLSLRYVLEAIAPELGTIPQYELGSRLSYALGPLD